jgi:CDP-paratose 2-epimerase
LSVIDLVEVLEQRLQRRIPLRWDDWRPGDQRIYVSDIRKLEQALDWKPEIGISTGITQLIDWVAQNRTAFLATEEVSQGSPIQVYDLPGPMVAHD